MDAIDWRAQLQPDSRQTIVNNILVYLKRYNPLSDEDELLEIQKIAQSVENKTYAGATSQSDYLQKISSKMHSIENTIDWRAQLHPESRQRITNKILDTLRRHIAVSGQEGLDELRRIAQRFEEKTYTAATSQPDYLRKISLKMLTMENKAQNTMANSMPSNPGGSSDGPSDGYWVWHAVSRCDQKQSRERQRDGGPNQKRKVSTKRKR